MAQPPVEALREYGVVMVGIGKALIVIGLLLISVGVVFVLGIKIPWLGNLPGDIYIQRQRYTFYFPITTCIVISLILTLVLYLLRR